MLAIGGKAGEAYTPSAWEWYFEAERFREPLDPEAALRLMDEANEQFPDHVGVIYSTACWLALAGRADEAWETLQRTLELDPRSREWARGTRTSPRFRTGSATEGPVRGDAARRGRRPACRPGGRHELKRERR